MTCKINCTVLIICVILLFSCKSSKDSINIDPNVIDKSDDIEMWTGSMTEETVRGVTTYKMPVYIKTNQQFKDHFIRVYSCDSSGVVNSDARAIAEKSITKTEFSDSIFVIEFTSEILNQRTPFNNISIRLMSSVNKGNAILAKTTRKLHPDEIRRIWKKEIGNVKYNFIKPVILSVEYEWQHAELENLISGNTYTLKGEIKFQEDWDSNSHFKLILETNNKKIKISNNEFTITDSRFFETTFLLDESINDIEKSCIITTANFEFNGKKEIISCHCLKINQKEKFLTTYGNCK
jgi:hypothetical protein